MIRTRQQNGFVLLPVVLAIVLTAVIAFMLNNQAVLEVGAGAGEAEIKQAEYVTKAGMEHAAWAVQNSACGGDMSMTAVPFGTHSYTASATGGGSTTAYSLPVDQDSWIRSANPTQNNGGVPDLNVSFNSGDTEQALLRFDLSSLPAGAQINSASAWFYVDTANEEGPVTVHKVSADWTEAGVTWDSLDGSYESSVLAVIVAQPDVGVWVKINLTAQVQAWVNGDPNNGILLTSASEGVNAQFVSREGAGNEQPYLDVVVGTVPASPVSIQATGTLANGMARTLTRTNIPAWHPPSAWSAQPGPEGKDAKIYQWKSSWNYGANQTLTVEEWAPDSDFRSLLQFDLRSIPLGAKVLSASLELYQNSSGAKAGTIGVRRITRDWVEGTSNGVAAPGVTWNVRDTSQPWTSAGGDLDATAYASTTLTAGTVAWFSWDITRLVSGWVNGSYSNQGLALVQESVGTSSFFDSSDSVTASQRPKLSITYACECGSVCMGPQGSGNVLFVVDNKLNPVPADQVIQSYLEAWGYTVSLIAEEAGQNGFNAEFNDNDVVLISESVSQGTLGTKVSNAPIGVVTLQDQLNDELGIATNEGGPVSNTLDVVDNDHYITRPFPAGSLRFKTAATELGAVGGTVSPDARVLANAAGAGALVALDAGGISTGGGNVPGRRVLVPTGRAEASWNYLTNNGLLVVQRALDWGMGSETNSIGSVLLVVVNPTNLTTQEEAKKLLIESWSYTVNLIDESDSQEAFDTAIAANDVAYVPASIVDTNLGTKLTNATIGVVNEAGELVDELGFANGVLSKSRDEIDVIDNSHYITETFATGLLTITSSLQSVHILDGGAAPGLQVLGDAFNTGSQWKQSMGTLDTGDELSGGGSAAGRRVKLPWGGATFDINALNDDGRTIMKRSIEWGASPPGGSGPQKVLFVVGSVGGAGLTSEEQAHQSLIESWGYTVEIIDDGASQADFDVAVANNDVVFMTNDITASSIGTKLVDATIGVVTSESNLSDEFGMASSIAWDSGTVLEINDNTHYITSPFSVGLVTYSSTNESLAYVTGTLSPDLGQLASSSSGYGVVTLDAGASMFGGGSTAGRRVQLPWGGNGFDPNNLTADGLTILQRAIEWGAGAGDSATGPIAHWKLDDGTGTTAIDSEGGHDGTLTNGPTWVAGQLGDALNFDGANDYVDLTSDAELDDVFVGGATVMAWIEPAGWGGSGYGRIFDKSSSPSATGDGWAIRLNTDNGGLNFGQGYTTNRGWWRFAEGAINLNAWQHIAIAYDASATTNDPVVYLNGSPVTVTRVDTPSGAIRSDAAINLRLGMHASSVVNGFDGKIDDARIYDSILDAGEISEIATGGGGGGGGGVVFEEFTEDADGSGTSLDIAMPPGTGSGDLLIVTVATDGSTVGSMSPPAGWTVIDLTVQSGAVTYGVWWKLAGASEPANYTFSWSGNEAAYGTVMRFTGHDPANPIHDAANAGGTSSTPSSPAVTTTVPNAMILRLGGFDDDDIDQDVTGLTGHTTITMDDTGNGPSTSSSGAGYVLQPAAGSSGTSNFALTASEQYRTVTIAIAPAP